MNTKTEIKKRTSHEALPTSDSIITQIGPNDLTDISDHAKSLIEKGLNGYFTEIPPAIYDYYSQMLAIYSNDTDDYTNQIAIIQTVKNHLKHELEPLEIPPEVYEDIYNIIDGIAKGEGDINKYRDYAVKMDNSQWNTRDYIQYLNQIGYNFRLNTLEDSMEINGTTSNSFIEAKIHNILTDSLEKKVTDSRFKRIIKESALNNCYNPIIQYLERVEQRNAKGVIDTLCGYFSTNDDELFNLYMKIFLVGSVQKAYTGKQNPMLVLDGKQGIGKSHFSRWIAPIPEYYLQGAIRPDSKDCQMNLNKFFIWEVSELGSTTRKADIEALKDFITKEMNTVRIPYEVENTKKKALANFIGTINNEAGFLRDRTGNRRFHVITVNSIDFSYTKIDVNDIWSNAVNLYRNGFSCTLTPEQEKLRDDMNLRYQYKTHLDDVLEDKIEITNDDKDRIKSSDLTNIIAALGVKDNPNKIAKEIKMYLEKKGIMKTDYKKGGKKEQGYIGIKINYE